MDIPERINYTARVTSTGGRGGHAISDDGSVDVILTSPSVGADPASSTNAEELFAAAWSACFNDAIRQIAKSDGVDSSGSAVAVSVGFGPHEESSAISVLIEVAIPGLDLATVQDLADHAHRICPYSKATRNNVPVEVRAIER